MRGWILSRETTEEARLAELESLQVLDTLPDERLDRLTALAARHFDAPIALVSLVDHRRQWFKSKFGLGVSETPRDQAFCRYTIHGTEPFIVLDATQDERFRANPLVTAEPNIRFYAGAPLITASGAALGSLCIIDTKARWSMRPQDKQLLGECARIAMRLIALGQRNS